VHGMCEAMTRKLPEKSHKPFHPYSFLRNCFAKSEDLHPAVIHDSSSLLIIQK